MFLKPQILKKIMKEAYKQNRLILAQNENTIYIGGRYWEVEINKEYIQKTILAEMIELTGEIPQKGECFLAGKGGNQMQIWETEISPVGMDEELLITDLILLTEHGTEQRVLQDPRTDAVLLLDNTLVDMIDESQIDYKREEMPPAGPFYNPQIGAIWYSDNGKARFTFRKDKEHSELLKQMEMINLWA